MNDLCGLCGASWECEHRAGTVVTSYVDDPYGPPVGRLVVAPQAVDVAAFLRRVADSVEGGNLTGDAVLVIVSDGDVHRPQWKGYSTWARLFRATHAVNEERDRRQGYGKGPEESAAYRQKGREQRAAETWKRYIDEPFLCKCGDHFKSEKGHVQHVQHWERKYPEHASNHHLVFGPHQYPSTEPT